MALIRCSDCGRDVSDRAVACPQCARPLAGRPWQTPRPTVNHTKVIGALLVIGGMVGSMASGASTSAGPSDASILGAAAFFVGLVVFVVARFYD